jgi:ACS family hexuronate transporter-like MFS transporter
MAVNDPRVVYERRPGSDSEAPGGHEGPEPTGFLAGKYRWVICGMLFLATTINYVDRQVLGILAPTLQHDIGWTEQDYGTIVSSFTFAYAIGYLFAGRVMDKLGSRIGFTIAIFIWSLSSMAHSLARSVIGFATARAGLGLGESGNFPGAIKTVAEWFPARERAFATGLFNAGSNVGAIVAPLMVPIITLEWGWQAAFIASGSLGFMWLIGWWLLYRRPTEHPRVTRAELAHIQSDAEPPAERLSWFGLLGHRQTWAFALGKFMTDPIWWFYLFWLPKFLDARFKITLGKLALPLVVIYVLADLGSVGGGWLSGFFIKRGWTVNKGRKITMLIAASLIVPTMFAPAASNLWVAVGIVGVAAASHQWWSANLFTTSSDMFPRHAVGSVVGIGGFAGAMGGVLFQQITGRVLQANGNDYTPIFVICGLAYVSALLVIHLLSPRLEKARLESA